MNRFFTLVVASILFIIFSSFFPKNNVTIKMDMPNVIDAGTEITVTVTISKGKVTDFARFQQELPYGFIAIAVNSANADFSFQDQKVNLVWLRVPDDNEIVFSYKILANERLTGSIHLGGRFTYIENNERKTIDYQPRLLTISPSPSVLPSVQVDVRDFAKAASIEAVAIKAGQAVALRQKPLWMGENKIFLITLLVNKDVVQKFAKIEETIPAGYVAASIDSKGGIFTFKDQVAKFIWMDLPSDPYFTITYKLIPEDGVIANAASMKLAGIFSYMINDRTFSSVIVERTETLAGLNKDQVNDLLRGITVQSAEQQPVFAGVPSNETSSRQATATPATTTVSVKPSSVTSSANTVKTVVSTSATGDMLKPESGVYYRVQIAAGHKPVNTQRYFRSYRLEYSVMRESHEGWWKYSVGSFAEYKDARDYRVHLSNTTKINDAFVAAYNNGKRITVQDALMALNQKWYK